MEISVLDASSLRETLLQLIAKHEQIYMAVAWAHAGPVADKLVKNKHKFKSVTFGLDFCATDPNFVEKLCNVPHAYVFKKSGACFHPKIYMFMTGKKAEAIVGSANFTSGGMGTNVEACLHISCNRDGAAITALLATLESYAPHRQLVTPKLAEAYRRQYEIAARQPRPPSPILPSDKAEFDRIDSDFVKIDWPTFISTVRQEMNHQFMRRMTFLRYIRTLFAREQSFESLTVSEWKAVAGISHPDAAAEDVGWFGSMQGSGAFTNLIANRDHRISKAVDFIPQRGPVVRAEYERYCELFTSAFADAARIGRYPTATRLLAMKRPDLFVCVNGKNRNSLANALHFPPSTLSLNNYWERVIEPIRLSRWYNSPRPEGRDAEAWECRAALVDAIFYNPDD